MAGELLTGMTVGRYRLERRIAKGGMGSVWAARDTRLDRDVAVKLLPLTLLDEPSAGPRFEREARAMGRLQHANVVAVFDIGTADPGTGDDTPYLVMELLQGRSLNQLLEDGPLPPRRAAKILHQVALALTAAHRAGVVHRDLKPSNIMVADSGHVKVLDFGLARLTSAGGEVPEETLTTPGIVLGSCPYMSPEQALGDTVGPASDIYSFGSVAYEVLSGRRAFEGSTPVQVMQAVARSSCPPLRQVAPQTPDALAAVVDRCLQREPARRYSDAAELAQDLETILDSEDSTMTRAPTILNRSSGVRAVAEARRWWMARVAVAAAVFLAAGVAAGYLLGRAGQEPRRPDPGSWQYRELLKVHGALNNPAWHPGGAEVAVEHHHGGLTDILAVPLDGGRARVLLAGEPDESPVFPAYSPDGAALAVVRVAGGESTLQVLPAVGGEPVAEVGNALHPTWVDASTVLFSRIEDGMSSLWTVRPDTGEERLVLEARANLLWWDAAVSGDGTVAVLGGPSDISAGLFVGSLAAASLEPWLEPGRGLAGFSWSASGDSLIAAVDRGLMWLTPDRALPLVPRLMPLNDPALSPDGSTLVAVNPNSSHELVAVDPDGGGWACVLCGVPDMGWGSVAADGAVAFRRVRGGVAELVIREPDGSTRRITPAGSEGTCPSFSPDGRRVAFLASEAGRGRDLQVVSREGGQPVTLATEVEGPEYPSWSPDGRYLAYAAGTPIRVWTVSAAGGEPRLVTPEGGDYPEWSPDGSWIAYVVWTEDSDPNQGAWVVAAEGGPPVKIGEHPTRLLWSPDGAWLYQLRQDAGRLELWQCRPGAWRWSRRAILDAGIRASVHEPYRPLTVHPATGDLVMNRKASADVLAVFEGLDPGRW
jgi:Tol biopolymer transport system component